MEREEVFNEINNLINQYVFPVEVLQDVEKRLSDSNCAHYDLQQLRYLRNNVDYGIAKKRETMKL